MTVYLWYMTGWTSNHRKLYKKKGGGGDSSGEWCNAAGIRDDKKRQTERERVKYTCFKMQPSSVSFFDSCVFLRGKPPQHKKKRS